MESVFEISVNDKAKHTLLHLYKWGLYLYICAFVVSISTVALCCFEYWAYEKAFQSSIHEITKRHFLTSWIHVGIYALLLPIHGYFLYRFLKQSRKALLYQDTEGFNHSFTWFAKQLIIASIIETINIVMLTLYIYNTIKIGELMRKSQTF